MTYEIENEQVTFPENADHQPWSMRGQDEPIDLVIGEDNGLAVDGAVAHTIGPVIPTAGDE